ncbi:MAG TPA: zf-HC2 domain-containing protein [Terriglobia bacterium]|nr:zf-HC2 domain-containing protein [Terriglobia bacterium]
MDEKSLIQFFKSRQTRLGQRRWGCLDETQIAAYADHQVTEGEKQRAEAHLADCDYCLDQLAFLIRMRSADLPESVPEPLLSQARKLKRTPAKSERNTVWVWGKFVAATAVVCLILITAISLRQPRKVSIITQSQVPIVQPATAPLQIVPTTPSNQAPTVRGGKKSQFTITVISPAPGGAPTAGMVELRWPPQARALDYVVIALTPDGDEIWREKTIAPSVRITSDANLQPGHKYFVTVQAFLMEGKSVQSDPVAFTVGNP